MYGLSPDIDLDFFLGKTLLQVCIGGADIILNFDGRVSITVTSSLSIGRSASDEDREKLGSFPQAANALATLLNKVVRSAHGAPNGTLNLGFSDGNFLKIYDDSKTYESYVIRNQDRVIPV